MNKQNTKIHIVVAANILMLLIAYYPYDIYAESQPQIYATWDVFEVDKCASIWLIKRFVDPEAKFGCIKRESTLKTASRSTHRMPNFADTIMRRRMKLCWPIINSKISI